jgi:DeoR/GlpR family transcriptional regulator of sugar metabolism
MFMPNSTGMTMTDHLPHERQAAILRKLTEEGRVLAADLAAHFETSEDTIRRDLREMAAQGLCRRVYGGALPIDAPPPLTRRIEIAMDRKQALARRTAQLIEPGSSLFIDAGSANLAVARDLPQDASLTVITNAPVIAAALMERPDIEVALIGGRMDPKSGAILGAKAMAEAASYRADICILGSCGLEIETGVSASFLEEAEFKRAMAKASRGVIAAVTNEKLGRPAPFPIIGLSKRFTIVVEHDADDAVCADLAGSGARFVKASSP